MTSTPHDPREFPRSFTGSGDTTHSDAGTDTGGGLSAGRAGWVLAPTPVSVWICGPLRDCPRTGHLVRFGQPPCAWRWPERMWDSILTSYSRPGDSVLITDAADGVPLMQGLVSGRRIAARIPSRSHRISTRSNLRANHSGHDPRNATVFSDRKRFVGTGSRAVEDWPARILRRRVDLMVVPPPCPADLAAHLSGRAPALPEVQNRGREAARDAVSAWQQDVLAERARLLRRGGLVAVLTRVTPSRAGALDRIGPLVSHARQLGLAYLQHNPIVHAEIRDSRLQPSYGPDDQTFASDLTDPQQYRQRRRLSSRPDSSLGIGPVGIPRLHMPVHSDLIVFIRTGGPL